MIIELKFNEAEFTGRDIASLPDRPGDAGITTEQLKAMFDNVGKNLIALGKFNQLIDALMASSGASDIGAIEIPGVSGRTVQTLIEGLKAYADNLSFETGALRLYTTATEPGSPGPYIWLQPTDSSIGLLALGSSAGDGLNVAVDDQTLAVTNAEAGTDSGNTLSYTIR